MLYLDFCQILKSISSSSWTSLIRTFLAGSSLSLISKDINQIEPTAYRTLIQNLYKVKFIEKENTMEAMKEDEYFIKELLLFEHLGVSQGVQIV
jgi:hypothetical protein